MPKTPRTFVFAFIKLNPLLSLLILSSCSFTSEDWGHRYRQIDSDELLPLTSTKLNVDSLGFQGALHNNISNKDRQGSGFTPLTLKSYPQTNIFRDDAVGLNFEHIFNGAKEQRDISMFTPRKDPCYIQQIENNHFEIYWPAEGSKWGMEARMIYDLSVEGQIDIVFECRPKKEMYPQGYAAMMWASYMNRTYDRKIHFWGEEGDKTGWIAFGEGEGNDIEVGTVSHVGVPDLTYEEGAQTLNLIEHPTKKFITPFYFNFIDGDHNLDTKDDKLLYLVLFDQTDSIRFAMWNFYRDKTGSPDTHSPAWDWQYVIRNPKIDKVYRYRTRIVIKPYKNRDQIWEEYKKWRDELGVKLPKRPPESRFIE